jgi:hypothetical protein
MRDIPTKPEEIDLAMAPLHVVAERLRADLAAIGEDKACGECGEAFSSARPAHGVVRHVAASMAGISMVHYLICMRCASEAAKRAKAGGSVATKDHRTLSLGMHLLGGNTANGGQS